MRQSSPLQEGRQSWCYSSSFLAYLCSNNSSNGQVTEWQEKKRNLERLKISYVTFYVTLVGSMMSPKGPPYRRSTKERRQTRYRTFWTQDNEAKSFQAYKTTLFDAARTLILTIEQQKSCAASMSVCRGINQSWESFPGLAGSDSNLRVYLLGDVCRNLLRVTCL